MNKKLTFFGVEGQENLNLKNLPVKWWRITFDSESSRLTAWEAVKDSIVPNLKKEPQFEHQDGNYFLLLKFINQTYPSVMRKWFPKGDITPINQRKSQTQKGTLKGPSTQSAYSLQSLDENFQTWMARLVNGEYLQEIVQSVSSQDEKLKLLQCFPQLRDTVSMLSAYELPPYLEKIKGGTTVMALLGDAKGRELEYLWNHYVALDKFEKWWNQITVNKKRNASKDLNDTGIKKQQRLEVLFFKYLKVAAFSIIFLK